MCILNDVNLNEIFLLWIMVEKNAWLFERGSLFIIAVDFFKGWIHEYRVSSTCCIDNKLQLSPNDRTCKPNTLWARASNTIKKLRALRNWPWSQFLNRITCSTLNGIRFTSTIIWRKLWVIVNTTSSPSSIYTNSACEKICRDDKRWIALRKMKWFFQPC